MPADSAGPAAFAFFVYADRTETPLTRFLGGLCGGVSLAQLLIRIKSFISVSELLSILTETAVHAPEYKGC